MAVKKQPGMGDKAIKRSASRAEVLDQYAPDYPNYTLDQLFVFAPLRIGEDPIVVPQSVFIKYKDMRRLTGKTSSGEVSDESIDHLIDTYFCDLAKERFEEYTVATVTEFFTYWSANQEHWSADDGDVVAKK